MNDMNVDGIKRGPGRPPMQRENPRTPTEDHKARAEARLAEIRAQVGDEPINTMDLFPLLPSEIPEGWTYEGKRYSVFNKDEPQYLANMMRGGWTPVPASRHPRLLYTGYSGDTIIKDGIILMERPKVLTDEARVREGLEARNAIAAKEAQLSGNTLANGAPQQKLAHSRTRSSEPMAIPQE